MQLQKENEDPVPAQAELSEIWLELLGARGEQEGKQAGEITIPTLESDPWSALLQAKGVEIVDLQKLHLHMSDQDVEQMLQIMQEQSAPRPKGDPETSADTE
jgi:hypothetical protein